MDGPVPAVVAKRRACVNCTTAKAKCSPRADGTCERCTRNGKPCVFQDMPERRRRSQPGQSQGQTRRFDKLEGKIEALTAQLSVINRQSVSSTNTDSSPGSATGSSSRQRTWSSSVSTSRFRVLPGKRPGSAAAAGDAAEHDDPGDVVDRGLVALPDAEARLDSFRDHYVARCPFVAVDASVSVQDLRRQSPLLFLAIMAVTEPSHPSLQGLLGEELRHQVSARLVFDGEKSLDILRGLLVYAAWFQYFFEPERPQAFLLLHLCITLVNDLGLEKRATRRTQTRDAPAGSDADFQHNQLASEGTSDEKRALLGTYWLATCVSRTLRKPSSMAYTQYMSQCCRELTDRREYSTDIWIEPLIRLQVLACSVGEAYNYHNLGAAPIRGDAAIHYTTRNLLHELASIESILPQSARPAHHPALDVAFLVSWIHEVALHDHAWAAADSTHALLTRQDPLLDANRTTAASSLRSNMLWRTLEENNHFLQALTTMPAEDLPLLCFATFSKLCYVLISQAKVAFALLDLVNPTGHASDGTHRTLVQLIIDKVGYSRHCGLLVEGFAAAAIVAPAAGERNEAMLHFGVLSKAMLKGYSKQLQEWLERRSISIDEVEHDLSQGAAPAADTYGPAPRTATVSTQNSADAMDMEVWQNFDFGPLGSDEYFDDTAWEAIMTDFAMPYK